MKKKEFVLLVTLCLISINTFGQPALPETSEGNVVVPIGNMIGVVALVCASYGLYKRK